MVEVPADTALGDGRWAKLPGDGLAADEAAGHRTRLGAATVNDHTAIATAANAEEREFPTNASWLQSELDRRTGAAPGGPEGEGLRPGIHRTRQSFAPGLRPARIAPQAWPEAKLSDNQSSRVAAP